jgi:hypothetical protein
MLARMAAYRDAQAELRIDTLEAKLTERDAAIRAREVEIVELRAELDRMRGDGAFRASAAAGWRRGVLAVAAVTLVAMGAATYARVRGDSRRRLAAAEREISHLHDQLARERAKPTPARDGDTLAAPPGAEFDRKAALRSLSDAAEDARGCGLSGGKAMPARRIKVTFAPTGLVSSAEIVDDAELAASPAGRCVAARFRRAHVPPFEGSPVVVSKAFSVPNDLGL